MKYPHAYNFTTQNTLYFELVIYKLYYIFYTVYFFNKEELYYVTFNTVNDFTIIVLDKYAKGTWV